MYISLPIIFCIIEYVTNKETLNLETLNIGLGCMSLISILPMDTMEIDLPLWGPPDL